MHHINQSNPIATRSPSTRRPHDARDRANDTNKNHVIASSSSTYLTARANIHIRAVIHERDDRLEVALGARLVQLRQSAKGVVIIHPHFSRVVYEEKSLFFLFRFDAKRGSTRVASRVDVCRVDERRGLRCECIQRGSIDPSQRRDSVFTFDDLLPKKRDMGSSIQRVFLVHCFSLLVWVNSEVTNACCDLQ